MSRASSVRSLGTRSRAMRDARTAGSGGRAETPGCLAERDGDSNRNGEETGQTHRQISPLADVETVVGRERCVSAGHSALLEWRTRRSWVCFTPSLTLR